MALHYNSKRADNHKNQRYMKIRPALPKYRQIIMVDDIHHTSTLDNIAFFIFFIYSTEFVSYLYILINEIGLQVDSSTTVRVMRAAQEETGFCFGVR